MLGTSLMNITLTLIMNITLTLTMYECQVQLDKANGETYTREFKSVESLVKSLKQSLKIKEFNLNGKVKIINQISLGFFHTYYDSMILEALQS